MIPMINVFPFPANMRIVGQTLMQSTTKPINSTQFPVVWLGPRSWTPTAPHSPKQILTRSNDDLHALDTLTGVVAASHCLSGRVYPTQKFGVVAYGWFQLR